MDSFYNIRTNKNVLWLNFSDAPKLTRENFSPFFNDLEAAIEKVEKPYILVNNLSQISTLDYIVSDFLHLLIGFIDEKNFDFKGLEHVIRISQSEIVQEFFSILKLRICYGFSAQDVKKYGLTDVYTVEEAEKKIKELRNQKK